MCAYSWGCVWCLLCSCVPCWCRARWMVRGLEGRCPASGFRSLVRVSQLVEHEFEEVVSV